MSDLIARLESVAPVAAPGDWADVVGRAEGLHRRTVRKRLLVVIAVALLAVPTIAIATGHWNLFSLTATDEEVPLPEGETTLGYVFGNEARLPGRPATKLAKPVGAYLGSQYPLVVPSADGRTLVYHAWVREYARRPPGALKSATNFLRVFDVETGRDRILERGAAGVALRRDGSLAYLRATEPEFRNGVKHWKSARFGHVFVRRTTESRPVRWTTTEAAWVPLGWAGRDLLVQSVIQGVTLPGGTRRFPSGVWAFSGPGRGRPLGIHTLVAVSPDGRFAFGLGSRNGSPSLLRVVEPSTGRIAVSVDIDELAGAQRDGIERDLLWLREGSWSGDTIIAASGSGSAPFQFPLDFTRLESFRREGVAGLTVLRYSEGKLSVERTLKLTGAVAEATGIRHRYSMFEFVHPIFVDSSARQFTSELRIIPTNGRSHFLFVTCDIEEERRRRGRLRKPSTTRAVLVYNPSRPLPD
jgi:hypothetical protein